MIASIAQLVERRFRNLATEDSQSRAPQDGNLEIFCDIQRTVQEEAEVFEAKLRSLELKFDADIVTIRSDAAQIAARRIIERLVHAEKGGWSLEGDRTPE